MQPHRTRRVPTLVVLEDSNFRTVWYASTLVELSRRMDLLVLSLFILDTTESVFQLFLVAVFLHLPRPFLSLISGVMADRFNRKRIWLASQSLSSLSALAMLTLLAADLLQPWQVFAAASLQGTTKALEDPSRRTAMFDIVGPGRVISAMSLETISNTIGKMAGPILAGVMIAFVSFTGSYSVVLAVHLLALSLLMGVKIPQRPGAARVVEPVWSSILESIRYAFRSRTLLGLLYITIVMNAIVFPIQQSVPAIGQYHLEVGPALVGLLASADGFGILAAAAVIGAMQNHPYQGRMFMVGALGIVITGLLFVWSPWYALAFTLLAIGGIGSAGYGTMQSSMTMLESPPEMRGRMMGLLSICIGIGSPLGTLETAFMAAAFSTQWAISVNLVVALLLCVPAIVLTPLVWQRSAQQSEETERGQA